MKKDETLAPDSFEEANKFVKGLDSQENLMKAAQKFSLAFDQDRRWTDDTARLLYTLGAWKELASAALEFSKSISSAD